MLMIIGARGWEHKRWNGSFYEDLLPEDWHLKFYSSQFDAALAPNNFWTHCSQAEIEEFCDDVEKDYPLIFEMPEDDTSVLYQSIKLTVPNWVVFEDDAEAINATNYNIRQAKIISASNLKNNCAVFTLSSKHSLNDAALKEAMQSIKSKFKQFDVVYLFLDDALVDIDIINTARTLLKMLSLT